MRGTNREVPVAEIVRSVYASGVSIEDIAAKCQLEVKEIKQIIKKGTVPIFDKKMKIIHAFKEIAEHVS